jgi:transglutaminase-like putative cysteine protease
MRYQIDHQTIYTYSQSVVLQPHLLRLRPRSNGWQVLHNFALEITPEPTGIAEIVDLDGNCCTQIWFTEPTEKLVIRVTSEVETLQDNPFNYLPEPWARQLPINYPSFLLEQLQPYLQYYGSHHDPVLIQFSQEILQEVEGNISYFLSILNQRIYQECEYCLRENGEPWPGGITWSQKRGSCRDFTLLFMDICRLVGLATRFVSGYQEGDEEQENRELHGWVEVYIPGGGWRGYDPTLGLAVSDRHIALVASGFPAYRAPIEGNIVPILRGGDSSPGVKLESRLSLKKLP